MIEVKPVTTRRQQREFLNFPLDLYKDNPLFVPPLYADERKMFRPGFVYNDCCDWTCFNAYRDGVMAGRIQGIIQRAYNEKNGERRARFCRFDAIRRCPRPFSTRSKRGRRDSGWTPSVGP